MFTLAVVALGALPALGIEAEMGFLAAPYHTVQFSQSGSEIDYVKEGGQDVLFPVARFSAELRPAENHAIRLLYQPLELTTEVLLPRALSVDGLEFPAGTPTEMRYSFPFWRASYFYRVAEGLEFGGALQIRDATISFASLDGRLFRRNAGVGPVPLLSVRGRVELGARWWVGGELEGFYAPISVLNGSDDEITGAIADLSLRAGVHLDRGVDAFVNLRYLGGGAVGTNADAEGPGDGYVKNWLHFVVLSLGARLELL